ncbi:nicotinate (nicotinamide) nucleotide adenylyltransferase [Kwoniella dendrophila CBS 6074]|uniref:Nicotinate (Nicotinamide) nucleotide adenylyltransferase n=1 Tax=Kwoniella dendrophila CBS 6074 TaxID=1295534 RepID=A0AAX4K1Z9_9TREE
MAANGFKSPAPVLPGLGLHSFHADSPPFAGAATSEHGDPDYLSLEFANQQIPPSSTHDDLQLVPERFQYQQQQNQDPRIPNLSQVGSSSSSTTIRPNYKQQYSQQNINTPIPQRIPIPRRTTSSSNTTPPPSNIKSNQNQNQNNAADDDASLSSSSIRTRTLLSGYMFGNPETNDTTRAEGGSVNIDNGRSRSPSQDSEEDGKYPLPTPPIKEFGNMNLDNENDDSPPLTEPFKSYSSPNPSTNNHNRGLSAQSSSSEVIKEEELEKNRKSTISPENRPASSTEATATTEANSVGVTNQTGIKKLTNNPEENDKSDSKNKQNQSQGQGYDALDGLNDGEADLDLSAPQAEDGGSAAYLRGEVDYNFPRHRLRKTMKDESKIPLVIVACGSFSPPTYLHLRMFEMAKDEIIESQTYEIMAGYYSPVSSYYKKSGLAPANHRVRMCELAVEHTSTWLMVDPWEAGQPEYQRTAIVLDHFDEMLNGGKNGQGGVITSEGKKRRYKIMLLAGGDLIESFGEPGVWSEPDLHIILGRFGCLIVERAGSDVWAFLLSHDILYHHRRNVIVIKQLIYNDISSTKVRLFVRRGMSIKYLLPNSVIQYIYDHKLYRFTDVKATIG